MDWKKKLASRKFWALLAGLITSLVLIFASEAVATQVAGIVLQLGAIVAYIWGESAVDAAYLRNEPPVVHNEIKTE